MSYDSMRSLRTATNIGINTEIVGCSKDVQESKEDIYLLPKDMLPNREAFETLGFTFEDTGDFFLYQTTLPAGWKVIPQGGCWSSFVDNVGRIRGGFFFYSNDEGGKILLTHRYYYTSCIDYKNHRIKVLIKDANDEQIIFEVGECRQNVSSQHHMLISKARSFLNKNYPDWEDATKYWD